MALHPLAGMPAPRELLVDVPALLAAYEREAPDPSDPAQAVAFGTSGHRGSSLRRSFNRAHILAVVQAVCDWRARAGTTGPLFLGKDTHALSAPAEATALEVLAGNGVETLRAGGDGFTPTPVISHAILSWNRGRTGRLADGIVVTPSHNPPEDGGIKYDPPHGGPADADVTGWIERRANELLRLGLAGVRNLAEGEARRSPLVRVHDYAGPYVADLGAALDLEAVRGARLRLGADPMGGANVGYWDRIAAAHGLDIEVVNRAVDPSFSFVPLDHDGRIRTDCSSPFAMAGLVRRKDDYDLAFGNDADSDRHGIVTPGQGLLPPNHYLAVAVDYLFRNREGWGEGAAVGKTLVSSSLVDRVAARLGRRLVEVPVGFKWFVAGLLDGSLGFAGEESAGASFLRRDGSVWCTDKDGILLDLLAAEIRARTGRDPGELYETLAGELGRPVYRRVDAPATAAEKAALKRLTPEAVRASELAGEPILARITRAPGNGADIGGLKVVARDAWFAARPSGTEDVYKIYAESFRDAAHLDRVLAEAQAMVSEAFRAVGA
ncbi:MAG TPA: phosphoglucomutase (alpha-D-glucose-1,6-bisphosphate-dependent) [Anaeromyxobacteraceae bacterium]|nr:phosphoglucomutase (alpha-D-glucose-1,6-bisphosphate-dependent) [Anaeromyxobacteraceae bacterium]